MASEKARLQALDRRRDEAMTRLDALYNQLAAVGDRSHTNVTSGVSASTTGPSTPKAGYAPACSNEFVSGGCDLPRVKCGDCPDQAFQPVDERAIVDHLQGRHVMGVYDKGVIWLDSRRLPHSWKWMVPTRVSCSVASLLRVVRCRTSAASSE